MTSSSLTTAVVIVVGAYLLGAVPFGLLVAKRQAGIDLLRYGSGSTGATNVYRAVGWKASTVVIVADVLKAAIPMVVAAGITGSPLVESAAGVAAVAGHCWPVYTGWRGGKGSASSLGALFVLNPIVGASCLLVAAAAVALTRYVSLGSVAGTTFGAVFMSYLLLTGREPVELLLFTILTPVIILIRHRDNISRLLAGHERRLGEKVDKASFGEPS